jgi:hypothetical protein
LLTPSRSRRAHSGSRDKGDSQGTFTEGVDASEKGLAPQVGFEPTTLRLTAGCSAIELLRNRSGRPNAKFNGSAGILATVQCFAGGTGAAGSMFRIAAIRQPASAFTITNVDHIRRSPPVWSPVIA